jgi:hypothetical protein
MAYASKGTQHLQLLRFLLPAAVSPSKALARMLMTAFPFLCLLHIISIKSMSPFTYHLRWDPLLAL